MCHIYFLFYQVLVWTNQYTLDENIPMSHVHIEIEYVHYL